MENIVETEKSHAIKENGIRGFIKEWMRFGLFLLAIVIIIPNSIGLTKISGLSMFPTLNDGNLILEEKVSKYFTTPKLGDVIIINNKEYGYKIVKRVIGIGGDTVEIKDGVVYLNQIAVPEIMTDGKPDDMSAIKVPDNHIFVIGDNRNPGESIDSRDPSVGPIPISQIDGYALFSIIPFQSIPKPITIE